MIKSENKQCNRLNCYFNTNPQIGSRAMKNHLACQGLPTLLPVLCVQIDFVNMSSVPSITAFVATQACQCNSDHIETNTKCPKDTKVSSSETDKSWLSTMFNKFVLVGHDGVMTTEVKQHQDLEPRKPQKTNSETQDYDILSRVRHLSDASSDGSMSPIPPLTPSSNPKISSVPER
uniref:Uncharacterized protein LOC100175416 n=1 Tax=Phallusia mammillata TaxID=59560 RepID=A0A6F9DFJ7_9ASCI|nr:uncharacterized protein LOC100175416 [Phallusia mammillata]